VRLIHWKAEEAPERAGRLERLGYPVVYALPAGRSFLKELREEPPLAVVIDLSRLPSQGRDLAVQIRKQATTRRLPLVFVGGDPQKVTRIRELLPDAVYGPWDAIGDMIETAITHPPEYPVVPASAFAAYAGKPLAQKLGIKADSAVILVNAPKGFEQTLSDLPTGARLLHGTGSQGDLGIWFARSRDKVRDNLPEIVEMARSAPLWIAWPKKASGVDSDLSQQFVRETGLAAGLVDYKICSIDATWSGLLFTKRKAK